MLREIQAQPSNLWGLYPIHGTYAKGIYAPVLAKEHIANREQKVYSFSKVAGGPGGPRP